MSFSSKVKEEVAGLPLKSDYAAASELAGMILFSGRTLKEMHEKGIFEFHSEHEAIVLRVSLMVEKLCGFTPEISDSQITLNDPDKVRRILKSVRLYNDRGQINEEGLIHDNPLLQFQDNKRAFIRGAFLAAGSITDPNKNYHFELTCPGAETGYQFDELLESFGLESKLILRKKHYILYIKEGSVISDLLNIMSAHISLMEFENIRIFKDVRNTVNRQVNCETANLNKTVSAAHKQMEDIEYIKKTIGLEKLPLSLREIAYARLEDSDASLKELGEMLDPPVGKSGVNHRLRRLSQMAQKLKEQNHL